MQTNFWQQRWKDNEIRFHEPEANAFLVDHLTGLNLTSGSRVLVPLCGKTLDIHWLLGRGYRVVGAELSKLAIDALFEEMQVTPSITQVGDLLHYQAESIDIFVGDIFDLNAELLGPVQAIYDRGALVALPEDIRQRYVRHLLLIGDAAPQLLITYQYNQQRLAGPPFSLAESMLSDYYRASYQLSCVGTREVVNSFNGAVAAEENAWLLRKR